jgi:hypothetical protein
MAVSALDIYTSTTAVALPYYRQKLQDDNVARFEYMNNGQKKQVRTRLASTLTLLRIDAEHHMQRQRKVKLKACCEEIQKCCDALYALDKCKDNEPKDEMRLDAGREQPLAYLGLYAHLDLMNAKVDPNDPQQVNKMVAEAKEFAKLIQSLNDPMNDELDKTRQAISTLNDNRRLHWVAGTSMFQALFDFMWAEKSYRFENQSQLENGMNAAGWPMGFLSCFIYLYRLFGVELKEAIQQAVSKWRPVQTSLVSLPDEGAWARFKADVSGIRKYILLNDFFWGAVNTLCFFWLHGPMSSSGGFLGAVLTMVFLVMDVILTFARYIDQRNAYFHNLIELENKETNIQQDIRILEVTKKRRSPERSSSLDAQHEDLFDEERMIDNQLFHLKSTLQDLRQAKKQLTFDWKYQQYQLWTELGYTVSLVAAFGMMCAFFTTGLVGATTVGLAGAVVWFGMTLVTNMLNAAIDQAKIKATIEERQLEAGQLVNIFNNPEIKDRLTPPQKTDLRRDLYLQIKALVARNEYDEKNARVLRNKALFQSFLHALAPVVIFCSMVMLPLVLTGASILASAAVSLTVIAFYFALVYVAKRWMDTWTPSKHEPQFFPSFEKSNSLGTKYEAEFGRLEQMTGREGSNKLTLSHFEQPFALSMIPLSSSPEDDKNKLGWVNEPVNP